MAEHLRRTMSSETLPAIRSLSPPPTNKPPTKHSQEHMTLPSIQSLTREFPSRLEQPHVERQRYSPPNGGDPQFQRKRTATGAVPGDATPPSNHKRRRVDSSDMNGATHEEPTHSAPLTSSESHLRRHVKQPSLHDSRRTSPVAALPSTQQFPASRNNAPSHEHRRQPSASGSNYSIPGPSHDVSLKQEQISPPAVIVQSPATPSTAASANTSTPAWQTEPSASFSRRISNASSSQRSTPRKLPPSRLTLQNHHSQQSLEANFAPSIRSAPPVPVPGQLNPDRPSNLGGKSTWLTGRTPTQARVSQSSQAPSEALTPRGLAREGWPSIPTPTSLRLGMRAIQPPVPPTQVTVPLGSPSGRLPITPAVPSPIPTLGSGTGLADKARFMQKMSEIYDKASAHKSCITVEEVDRRIRDALGSRDAEIITLKKEISELKALLTDKTKPSVDADGDVTMNNNPSQAKDKQDAVNNPPETNASSKPDVTTTPTPLSDETASPPVPTPPDVPNGKSLASASPEAQSSTTDSSLPKQT
ncbi:hypothetical protein CPB86DRAFT_782824 [Serendipita vermifera]|nr:hypothetical protein CPB86DRAFT_782824 [Serendipita vermifera]